MNFHFGSFSCGAAFCLLIFYLGTIYRIDTLRNRFLRQPLSTVGVPSVSVNETFSNETFSNENATVSEIQPISIKTDVENATFGFERIFALGLPERSDRRDRLTLMSSYQDVRLEWMDAVRGEDIKQVAWPPHWNSAGKAGSLGELGCWKSHVNALRKVIDEGLSSALIIEDDADWDVDLRTQLYDFAIRTRELGNGRRDPATRVTDSTPTESPYGDDWDILWIGACAWPQSPPDSIYFPGPGQRTFMAFWARGGMACTWGYAINRNSAKSLLAWLLDIDEAIDFSMGQYCEIHNCISVWPPLIGAYVAAGSSSKDSDIRNTSAEVHEQGQTMWITHSAIVDMQEKWGHKLQTSPDR